MLNDSDESSYRSGTRAIDRREYEHAVEAFDRVIERKSSRADGALYWKAYAQNKLGRRDAAHRQRSPNCRRSTRRAAG